MPDRTETQVIVGVFDYLTSPDGWNDSFRVVDDDGMSFVLTNLRSFQDKEVRITITTFPLSDS